MIELLKGKLVSDTIKEEIESKKSNAHLAIVRVGENPADLSYERSATKKLTGMGLTVSSHAFDEKISVDDFKAEFSKINDDASINGILVMRPLPKALKEAEEWMELTINPKKDVDCISPINVAGVMRGDTKAFAPCTAQSVIEILKGYGVDLKGKDVTIIGRSIVVGKPLAMLLLKENATVTICHTKTADLAEKCKRADILVVAAGHAKLIGVDSVRDGQIVIDVGTNVDADGNLCGDFDLASADEAGINIKATPVPGGVGVVTTAVLAKHVAQAAEM